VLLFGDLMASATWLANPSLQKDGRHHLDLPFAGIVV